LLKQSVGALKGEKVKPRIEVRVALDFLDTNSGAATVPSRSTRESANGSRDSVDRRKVEPAAVEDNRAPGRTPARLPHTYVPEPQNRIEIYRKLAQATDRAALESLVRELRDRFGPLPAAVELLLQIGELKILAGERAVTVIEVKEDKLMLTRRGDFITLGGKFLRLTKEDAKGRLKEIKKLLMAL